MSQPTWFITGVSSGFGRQLTDRLLGRGDCVAGTVRDIGKVTDLLARYPEAFHAEVLDVTDTAAIREFVGRSFARLGRIDVIVGNAGYGLFGVAEELTDKQVEHIVATNLVGSIQLIRAALPPPRHAYAVRRRGRGRVPPTGRLYDLAITSLRRSRVRKNFTESKRTKSFSRPRLLNSLAGRRIPCCVTWSWLRS